MEEEQIKKVFDQIRSLNGESEEHAVVSALRPTSQMWFGVKEMLAEDWGQETATEVVVDIMKHHLKQQVDAASWQSRI